jgi:hypothetical protein
MAEKKLRGYDFFGNPVYYPTRPMTKKEKRKLVLSLCDSLVRMPDGTEYFDSETPGYYYPMKDGMPDFSRKVKLDI